MAPATTPATRARLRKAVVSGSSSLPRRVGREEDCGQVGGRRHSQHADQERGRVEPAEKRSPSALPTGTRPDAIAADRCSERERREHRRQREDESDAAVLPSWGLPLRSAYAVPRMMMPTAAMNSGTASVDAIDPNATG